MAAGGALDVVFVLEDKADPACAAIGQLLRELAAAAAAAGTGKEQAAGGGSQGPPGAGAGAGRRSGGGGNGGGGTAARMEFSGQAADTSQKIHK